MNLNKIIYNVETNKPVEIDLNEIVKGRALFQANSGGFSNAISKLRTLGLIEYSNGQLKATEDMFP